MQNCVSLLKILINCINTPVPSDVIVNFYAQQNICAFAASLLTVPSEMPINPSPIDIIQAHSSHIYI